MTNPYQSPQTDSPGKSATSELSPEFVRSLRTALLVNLGLAAVTFNILDGGQLFRAYLISLLGHLMVIFVISIRRSLRATKFDFIAIRWGVLPIFLAVASLGPLLIRAVGLDR